MEQYMGTMCEDSPVKQVINYRPEEKRQRQPTETYGRRENEIG